MELVQVGDATYYIKNATNIGVYLIDSENVYLIDTGNDKEAGKKIFRIIEEKGWKIKGIINTHSNADHIGGNVFLQNKTDCLIFGHHIESSFVKYPILEPAFLYGGYPFSDLQNKFLMAKSSDVLEIEGHLPDGLDFFPLKGHFFDMIGIKTSDDVYFLADSLFSEETISKYHLFFIYDVGSFLDTLDYLSTLRGKFFIPSHSVLTEDLSSLIQLNRDKVYEIMDVILEFCLEEHTFEEILKYVFDFYQLSMNSNQYVLVGSTVRSYLSYLCDHGKLCYHFLENRMLWKKVI